MSTITPEGTARQICEWLGVPDPSIKPVMKALGAKGLQETTMGIQEITSPCYNTAQAFDLYYRLTRQLPPDAAQFLARALNELRAAADRDALARKVALRKQEAAAQEEARVKAEERLGRQVEAASLARTEAESYALEHGLATFRQIARRYGQLGNDDNVKPSFQRMLNSCGLKHKVAKCHGVIKLFRQEDADAAVASSDLSALHKRPKKSWSGGDLEPKEAAAISQSKFWAAEAFLVSKRLGEELVNPRDYAEIERVLNTEYALKPIEKLGATKYYRLTDIGRAWQLYVADFS